MDLKKAKVKDGSERRQHSLTLMDPLSFFRVFLLLTDRLLTGVTTLPNSGKGVFSRFLAPGLTTKYIFLICIADFLRI